ncbi:MAG: hypothetical protein AAFY78_20890 [Cyanobacteria bacterium J06648_16]
MGFPKIVFYLPPSLWPETWPKRLDDSWPGFGLGVYAWTIQTCLRLQAVGFTCELSQTMPEQGIVLFHSNVPRLCPSFPKPTRQQLFICLKAEAPPSAYAQLQVVQNPQEVSERQFFIPHWPQPGLLPRLTARGDRFETIAFLGHRNSLATALQSPEWQAQLRALGLRWRSSISQNAWNDYATLDNRWHDYREVDAVVAVRSFEPRVCWQTQQFRNKPATKLYNAWLAGVPAVLGVEQAYRAERQTVLDYLEVDSQAKLLATLQRLRDDRELRLAMMAQAQQRATDYTPDAVTQHWIHFFETVAIPAYEQWRQCSTAGQRWVKVRSQSQNLRARLHRRLRAAVCRPLIAQLGSR